MIEAKVDQEANKGAQLCRFRICPCIVLVTIAGRGSHMLSAIQVDDGQDGLHQPNGEEKSEEKSAGPVGANTFRKLRHTAQSG